MHSYILGAGLIFFFLIICSICLFIMFGDLVQYQWDINDDDEETEL